MRNAGLPRLGYQPSFDGVRAVAVCSVIGFHFYRWPLAGGEGVTIFFVLSGFLITALLREEWQQWGYISLPKFYARRALRLLPALVFFLCGYAVIAVTSGRSPWAAIAVGITYTMNFVIAFDLRHVWLGHLWSLAVEEQFYLAWPLLLSVMLVRGFSTLKAVAGAAVGAVALIVLRDFLGYAQIHDFSFDALLIGCCAGLLFTSHHRKHLTTFCSFPVVAACALTLVGFFLFKPPILTVALGTRRLSLAHITLEVSVAIVLVWLVDGAPGLRALHWTLACMPFRYVGRISYALYLWHSTVLAALLWHGVTDETVARIVAVVGSLAIATISYYLVEQPFLRRKWRLARTETHDRSLEAITAQPHPSPATSVGAA